MHSHVHWCENIVEHCYDFVHTVAGGDTTLVDSLRFHLHAGIHLADKKAKLHALKKSSAQVTLCLLATTLVAIYQHDCTIDASKR